MSAVVVGFVLHLPHIATFRVSETPVFDIGVELGKVEVRLESRSLEDESIREGRFVLIRYSASGKPVRDNGFGLASDEFATQGVGRLTILPFALRGEE